jgi:transcriptional regulator with XRE-family HTH domain
VSKQAQEMVLPQFAVNLRAARHAAGLSQERLARRIDVGLRAVQGWEHSQTMPRTRALRALSDELGHEPAWFYTDHEPVKSAA